MTLLWSDFRTQIRRSILKDPNATRWTNPQVTDFCGWALDAFCAHTAVATATSFETSGTDYEMPDNVYDDLETTAVVSVISGTTVNYLDPIRFQDMDSSGTGYYVLGNTVKLTSDPGSGKTLRVEYFAYYNKPVNDADTIDVPSWARSAIANLVGAYAMTPEAAQEVQISRWKEKPESGSPDDSALRAQHRWLLQVYQGELDRHKKQSRENFWRRDVKGSG